MGWFAKWAVVPRMGTLTRRANDAVSRRDWIAAASAYEAMVARQSHRADLRIQLGHCLKEAGKGDKADLAYSGAAQVAPEGSFDRIDAMFHLGLLRLQQGHTDPAILALGQVLQGDPAHTGALDALWHARLLTRLPRETLATLRAVTAGDVAACHERLDQAQARLLAVERYPGRDYTSFRPAMTLAPPTEGAGHEHLNIVIDARGHAPAFVRITLESLLGQRFPRWSADVHVDVDVAAHPVASLAEIDPRLRFIVPSDDHRATGGDVPTVFISAGSRLDPEALGWISYGLSLLDEGGLDCDWDWCTHRWDGPVVYTDPQLNGLFDLDRLLSLDTPPPLVAFRVQVPEGPLDGEGRRHALAQRSVHSPIGHVPLPLVAIGGIAERAKIAPENGEPMPLWSQPRLAPRRRRPLPLQIVERDGRPALTCGPLQDASERIRIIIPTRDCVAELAVAIESLIDTAHHPEALTFCLIDNRSVEPETISYLKGAAERDRFEVLSYDAPFNWSAINNYGAKLGDEPILLFANNDIRMLSSGWDDRLRAQLQRRDVGAVGARLLYPDGSIQHAGIVFDIFEGAPQHDGVGLYLVKPETDPRFDHPAAFGAVTGAFLGLRRTVFQDAGRLDGERFIIAYNDIDLCLSLRSLGLRVLYDAGIEAIHYESRTRGFNDNRRRVAWDQEELRALHQKWGDGMRDEPGLSPWWHREERYFALRPQTGEEIASHLRRALSHGWRPRQA